MKIQEALQKMTALNSETKRLLKEMKFNTFEDLSGLEYDSSNMEDALIREELRSACDHLDSFRRTLNYLNRDIMMQGVLRRNERGRFEIRGGDHEYTSGSEIEFLFYDDSEEMKRWCVSRVEFAKDDYYIVGYSRLPMDGLEVRVREIEGVFSY